MRRGVRILWFVLVDINALDSTPLSLVRTRHSDHLHLSVDWPSEGPSGDAQVHVRVHMSEADTGILAPVIARANDFPVIASVSLALLVAVAGDLLVSGQWTGKVVRVQVLIGRDVVQPDGGATGHWFAPFAERVHFALDSPMTVHIVLQFGGSDRLLSRPRTIFNVMGVQSDLVGVVQQLKDGPAGYMLCLGS